jgi:hypothetical protein
MASVNSLSIQFRQFRLPKRGEKAEDYEDASDGDPARGRFAIADGAAGSSFSALWARLLVEEFVRAPKPQPMPWADWLPAVQQRWNVGVGHRPSNQPTPWFLSERIQQGAFAAFLGLVLDEVTTWRGGIRKRWRVLAIGDTCFFQVRGNRLIKAVPIKRSRDFGNTPWLVGSRTAPDRTLTKQSVQYKGEWTGKDRLWLMTDALALWFLQQTEAGKKPWREMDGLLLAPQPERAFAAWMKDLRDHQRIRNDDVTLMAVCL